MGISSFEPKKEVMPMKSLVFKENLDSNWPGVKSFWDEKVRSFMLRNVRRQLERILGVSLGGRVLVACIRGPRGGGGNAMVITDGGF